MTDRDRPVEGPRVPDGDDDPYLAALLGIGAELTAIRQQLQRLTVESAAAASAESLQCRCGASFDTEAAAREHAVADHKAPAENWQELY